MAWSFVSANIEQWDGKEWVTDAWSMPAFSTRLVRVWMKISSQFPPPAYPPYNVNIQVNYGSGYSTIKFYKTLVPFRVVGLAEFVGEYAEYIFGGQDYEGTFTLRGEFEWTGGPYYSNELSFTLTQDGVFVESIPMPGDFDEQDKPTGSWTEQDKPSGSWTEQDKPSGGFTETEETLVGAFAEQDKPAGSWTEQDKPGGTWTEQDKPTGTWTEQDKPSGSFSETEESLTGSFSEQSKPSGSWTEQG